MAHKSAPKTTRVSTVSREASDLERHFYGQLIGDLAQARRRRNLSQEDLDGVLGVSAGLVGKWESFGRAPSAFMLVCWCNALDVNLSVAHRRHLTAKGQDHGTEEPPHP